MVFFKDEKAVSEIVGVMLLLLIGVVYLGVIQAYEVTEWNKEIERQHFDKVYSDFATLRSDLENVAILDIPKSTNINMGVRYPERFMLNNPGPGVYGTISTYPLNVSISYENSSGNTYYKNYTSNGIEYKMNGLLPLPKLVYENGLIIQDYGNINISVDDRQKVTTGDNIYIPIINGTIGSVSSISLETFTILPMKKNVNKEQFDSMNVSIETRYPDIWQKLAENIDIPEGSEFNITGNTIKITNIWFGEEPMHVYQPDTYRSNELYSGMITFNNFNPIPYSGEIGENEYILSRGDKLYNIPPSDNFSYFIIRDITVDETLTGNINLDFKVKDSDGNEWSMNMKFFFSNNCNSNNPSGSKLCVDITQKKPNPISKITQDINDTRMVDLTSYYLNASINQPNILTVDKKNDDILYVVFDIK
ncbi:MAG: hypothetical protein SCH70_00355 [Candidatus Methanoperedens sp.]|nr:hypothetical protein [Candidatus Methanoperedens sp.]